MADWRKLAKALVLMEGHVSEKEVNLLREHILADAQTSNSEIQFLQEIKAEAKTSVKILDNLIEECRSLIK